MRRVLLLLSALLLTGTAFLAAHRAHAFEGWCFDDPIIAVNGNLVDVRVELPLLKLLAMRSTSLTVVIPQNVSGSVVLDDVSVFPMKTTISPTGPAWNGTGSIPVTIRTMVNASGSFSIQTVATPLLNLTTPLAAPTGASGTTNATLSLPLTLGHY
jgi:hypothetical protein